MAWEIHDTVHCCSVHICICKEESNFPGNALSPSLLPAHITSNKYSISTGTPPSTVGWRWDLNHKKSLYWVWCCMPPTKSLFLWRLPTKYMGGVGKLGGGTKNGLPLDCLIQRTNSRKGFHENDRGNLSCPEEKQTNKIIHEIAHHK